MNKAKKTFINLIVLMLTFLLLSVGVVIWTDPFMQYHKPAKCLFLKLDDERYQNFGIVRQMDYDSIITGSSITENFLTSQFDELMCANSVKVPFSGCTYYEGARIVEMSYASGKELKYVLKSFDLNHLIEDKDQLRTDLGEYPDYLINDTILDDYKYILNKDVMLNYVIPMVKGFLAGHPGGHTSFDKYPQNRVEELTLPDTDTAEVSGGTAIYDYRDWMDAYPEFEDFKSLSEEEKQLVFNNVNQNIINLAKDHPETQFIYYVAPYGGIWWGDTCKAGNTRKYYEAEKLAFNLMLRQDNIRVFCFSNKFDITFELENYSDEIHYRYFINDAILQWIANDEDRLTLENYEEYINLQYETFSTFDYNKWLGK